MTTEPVRYPELDDVTTKLLGAVEDLRTHLQVHGTARILRLRAAVVRDLADQLYLDLEDVPHVDRCSIRYDAT